jgi:peptidoglycan hydrolase-like protein with peptidoglycan-binding domain
LVYTNSLPADQQCNKIIEDGETLYLCDGVIYRSTYYQDEKVYEIVSDPVSGTGEPQGVVGLGMNDPMMRGEVVRDLQNRLVEAGYGVGGVDGVFGTGTETALMWFQYDNGMDATGFVDPATAVALGFESPADLPPAAEPQTAPATEPTPEE